MSRARRAGRWVGFILAGLFLAAAMIAGLVLGGITLLVIMDSIKG